MQICMQIYLILQIAIPVYGFHMFINDRILENLWIMIMANETVLSAEIW